MSETDAQPRLSAADAARTLADIDAITARVRQSRIYMLASTAMVVWGPLVACAYAVTQFWPRYAAIIWPACHVIGFVTTVMLARRHPREASRRGGLLVAAALAIIIAYGVLWSVVFGQFGPRQMSAFWPTLFMFAYTVAGLWFGRAFVMLGLTVTALTMVGYVWAGHWFDLYMSVVNGGGLLLCGLWMRRA